VSATEPSDFRTTRWTMVLGAGRDDAQGRAALEQLCGTYWYPLYAVARRKRLDAGAAEDAVQAFFADLLARGDVARADPERGRFRAYLCTAFRNHLAGERKRARALKRGGGQALLSLDAAGAEQRYSQASGKALDPEALFDRAWALTLLEGALARVRGDYAGRDQEVLFDALRETLTEPEGGAPRAQLAEELGMTEGALKVAVHRLRGRYREALLAAVRDTVEGEADVQAELGRLFAALGGG
jgi:RNA polymerase sigma factor (sigma-70 family)